ncbi:MAG: hypothetical protein M1831_005661 [Alyxoria varia]|nr:MAG: hypothetical protein M1831_005661 [Alyxoria varia]
MSGEKDRLLLIDLEEQALSPTTQSTHPAPSSRSSTDKHASPPPPDSFTDRYAAATTACNPPTPSAPHPTSILDSLLTLLKTLASGLASAFESQSRPPSPQPPPPFDALGRPTAKPTLDRRWCDLSVAGPPQEQRQRGRQNAATASANTLSGVEYWSSSLPNTHKPLQLSQSPLIELPLYEHDIYFSSSKETPPAHLDPPHPSRRNNSNSNPHTKDPLTTAKTTYFRHL